jgi:YebC/PmpR family DNA-binding regulatory protein
MGRGPSIENRKNAEDSRRGKLFTKLIREVTLAARAGGGDPAGNARLRLAMDKALHSNMTKETLERAIRRGSGEGGGELAQEVRYEGYGPGGVAVIVDCVTDNPTRTVADVRHAFSKFGGAMGTSGSVAFQFALSGEIIFDVRMRPDLEDRVLEIALESGADDVQTADGYSDVVTTPAAFEAVKLALTAAGLVPLQAEVTMRPANRTAIGGEAAELLNRMIDRLNELDDVQEVYHNADFPEESAGAA